MRVLLTNNSLNERAGSELYLLDVAVELLRRGHRPIAYSTQLGPVARELKAATVPVIDNLQSLGEPPDIIHGQHHYETLAAMLQFPGTPAIAYCHGWIPWEETPLRFPAILHYVAVDELCKERLIVEGGIPASKIDVIYNFFDARRFTPRDILPDQPRRALAFSNGFGDNSDLPILREACRLNGIELHATGLEMGRSETDPGRLLQRYDLVFAKARAAIEALAVGCAVVLCNPGKLGPLVTPENFARLRQLNFGVRVLDRPLTVELLEREISRYSSQEAEEVSKTARSQCELQPAVDALLALYGRVIDQNRRSPVAVSVDGYRAVSGYLAQHSAHHKQLSSNTEKLHRSSIASEAERDSWRDRCLAGEADRDHWKPRGLLAETERDELKERCLAGEADRDHWRNRGLAAETGRDQWLENCRALEADLALSERQSSAFAAESKGWQDQNQALEADRAIWAERCAALEEDLHRWKERCVASEASRERWLNQCMRSEVGRSRATHRYNLALADLDNWTKQCTDLVCERAAVNQQSQHDLRSLEEQWQRRYDAMSLLQARSRDELQREYDAHLERSYAQLRTVEVELADMRSWPAWRLARHLLESYPLRRFVRPGVRAVRHAWRSAFAQHASS